MRKLIKLLVIVFIFLLCSGNVLAEGDMVEVCVDDIVLTTYETQPDSEELLPEVEEKLVQRIIDAAVSENPDEINIADLKIPISNAAEVNHIFCETIKNNPIFFYVEKYFLSAYENGEYIIGIILGYNSHLDDGDSNAFYSKANYIIASVVDDDMSDEEKALALHDYIIDNTTYITEEEVDSELYPFYTEGDVYNAYGVIMNGFGVCSGYSMAYNLLLDKVGIETKYVTSEELHHGWSLVKLDDKWYHVDVTWDDPITENHPYDQIVNHEYFLLSDESIIDKGHISWETETPVCDDKTYEDESFSFYMTRTKMKYLNGKYYYQSFFEVETVPPGETYYIIDGKKYMLKYVSAKFDGSERTVVSEDVYNNIDTESKKIYSPIKYIDGVATEVSIKDINDSLLYVKGFDILKDTIYITCYDHNKRFLGMAKITASDFDTEEYTEFTISNVDENTKYICINTRS